MAKNNGSGNGTDGSSTLPIPAPLELVAIDMGYGHLRPAHSLSELLAIEVQHADRAPLASPREQRQWGKVRAGYELLSRTSQLRMIGGPLRELMQGITSIPSPYPRRDLSHKTFGVRVLESLGRRGLGTGLAAKLERGEQPLLTTFYGPAVLADFHGCQSLYCIVTDADINRVWAPIEPQKTKITYFAPCMRARRRLRAYGVPSDRIVVTGFPLPHGLVGGPDAGVLRSHLARRLVALDPRGRFFREGREEVSHFLGDLPSSADAPLHLTFAVGGAGAQSELAHQFLPSLGRRIRKGKLKVTLVAGIRPEVADTFRTAVAEAGLVEELESGAVSILLASSHDEYFEAFNQLLAVTDILWTKPSELTFFGALGIPLILSYPVGAHERYNRRWAIHSGAGIKQFDPRHAGDWLGELVKDGTLAGAAWSGYMRMPKFGLYRIIEEVLGRRALDDILERKPRWNFSPPPPSRGSRATIAS